MNKSTQVIIYTFIFCFFLNCSSSDDEPNIPTGNNKSYDLLNTNLSDLTGNVKFIENTNGSITIIIKLNNTVDGINNAVNLRNNTANIGGGSVVTLNDVDGNTGISETTVTKLNNGKTVNYEDLSEFLGYISIEGKGDNAGEFYAYADLGPNILTGIKMKYNLFASDESVNGFALFEERKKGTAALTLNIFEINDNTELPASIHIVQDSNLPEIIHPLNTVKSKQNGFSFNEITEINEIPISYNNLLKLDGFIAITDAKDTTLIISKGRIGTN